ncbi:MAG: hypothetical protein JJU29_20550 [Verrucomicrobia bacterium]|nr:hypothetical protein [Verrucomicrobiota bacterium]MCH8514182.1 hypothetical protein [Kiritimatiellia bacterium]
MLKRFFLITIFCALFVSGFAQETVAEQEAIFSRAFLAMMDGDKQLEAGNRERAADLYLESMRILKDLQKSHPDFNHRIVAFRISHLQEQLDDLLPDDPPVPTRIEPAVVEAPPPREDYERLYIQTKEEALRNSIRLLDMEKRYLDLQMNMRERDTLLQEQREELTRVRRDLERERNETGRELREAKNEVQSQRRFNTLLENRVTEMEAEAEKLKETVAAQREEEALLNVELQDLRGQLADARRGLEEHREASQAEIDQLGSRLLARGESLREAEAKNQELHKRIETIQEQIVGLPLLEDTVIELNRRLKGQEEEMEALREENETLKAQLNSRTVEGEAREREQENALVRLKEAEAAEQRLREKTDELERALQEQIHLTATQLNQQHALKQENQTLLAQLDEAMADLEELRNSPQSADVDGEAEAEGLEMDGNAGDADSEMGLDDESEEDAEQEIDMEQDAEL